MKTRSMPSHWPGEKVTMLQSKCRLLQNACYFQPEASLTCIHVHPPPDARPGGFNKIYQATWLTPVSDSKLL